MQLGSFVMGAVMVAVIVMAVGLLMVLSGASSRGALPIEERSHRGLGRLSVGIVMMSLPVLLGLLWLLATFVLELVGGALR